MSETEDGFLHVRVPGAGAAVIRLDADPAIDSVGNVIVGGNGADGTLALFRPNISDTTNLADAAFVVDASLMEMNFRGSDGEVTTQILGGLGKILAASSIASNDAEVALYPTSEFGTPTAQLRARDPVTGLATFSLGATGTSSLFMLHSENADRVATLQSGDATVLEIGLGNQPAFAVDVRPFGTSTTSTVRIGGDDIDGTLHVVNTEGSTVVAPSRLTVGNEGFPGEIHLRGEGDEASILLNASGESARVRVGWSNQPGRISTRDEDNEPSIVLDGRNGDIWCGGSNQTDGNLLLFPRNSDVENPGDASIHLNARNGAIRAGTQGLRGLIVVRDETGNDTVVIDGQSGDISLLNGDCAEAFPVADANRAQPGTVMVLDDHGLMTACTSTYDTSVVGVVSGAGSRRPGIVLNGMAESDKNVPLALIGTVQCKVSADCAPIGVGDLLTTSDVQGHAMRASDPTRAFGAIIGKALEPLATGRGLVRILICLQ